MEVRQQSEFWAASTGRLAAIYSILVVFHPLLLWGDEWLTLQCPDYFGKGYATEALKAFVNAYFERVPTSSAGPKGFDYLEASADTGNPPSMNVLRKAGFSLCGVRKHNFSSPHHGWRDSAVFRIARHGVSLAEMGLDALPQEEE